MTDLTDWSALQQPAPADEQASSPQRPYTQWWQWLQRALVKPVPLWTVGVVVAGLFVAFGVLAAFAPQAGCEAEGMAKTTPTVMVIHEFPSPLPTATASLAPTVTPTPTPVPQAIVWAPGGTCGYVRAEPSATAETRKCLPNGTRVQLGAGRQDNNGFTWAQIVSPEQGWMALDVVVWEFAPNAAVIQETALYDDHQNVLLWLPLGTPLYVEATQDGQAWVQLPNGYWGWVRAEDLQQ